MFKSFNSFCQMRVFSEIKKNLDCDIWTSISLRNGSGFNFVTRRLYFDIVDMREAVSKLIMLCKGSYFDLTREGDMGEMYVCLDKRVSIEDMNGAELSKDVIKELFALKADFIFSVEEIFPKHGPEDLKFE